MDWKLEAALTACLVLGLRHGFDYDHLAAISDITSVQPGRLKAVRLGVVYALGHALMVCAMGVAVISLHVPMPGWLDHLTERLIGVTLILLGIAVVAGMLHPHAHPQRMQSRIAAGVNFARYFWWRFLSLFEPGRERPALFAWNYNGKSVFLIGMLHGIGAETPSQVALFLLTAKLGGTAEGLWGLAAFALGLVLMNALMTASLAGLFGMKALSPGFYKLFAWGGALYSCGIGVIFLAGSSSLLPNLQ
jgi:high-affinity nickel-transport protein